MKQALVGQGMYREQENSHLEWPDHTLYPYTHCTTLTILVYPLTRYPWGQVCRGHCNQIPQIQYRQQQPQSIKIPTMLRRVICQDVGKFWSQELTRSMERESIVGVPCPVIRKVSHPGFSQTQSYPHREVRILKKHSGGLAKGQQSHYRSGFPC